MLWVLVDFLHVAIEDTATWQQSMPYSGCMKNVAVIDLVFVFSPFFLENIMHAVTAGMDNIFIC